MAIDRPQVAAFSLSLLVHATALSLLWRSPGIEIGEAAAPEFMQVSLITLAPQPETSAALKPVPMATAKAPARPASPRQAPAESGDPAMRTVSAPTPVAMPAMTQPRQDAPASEDVATTESATPAPAATSSAPRAKESEAQATGELQIERPHFRKPPQPPVYPRLSRVRGESGTVLLRARVETNGTVSEIRIKHSSGHDLLDRAAVAAVRDWEIEPYRRNHSAMVAWVELPVIFELRGPESLARHP